MRLFAPFIVVCILFTPPATCARGIVTVAGEGRLPVIERWQIAGDTSAFPLELVHADFPADLSIFKSGFSAADAVRNPEDLRYAVDGVLEQVIYELPDAELLTNTGYYRNDVAGFVLEFRSRDNQRDIPIYHRLKTAIYTTPDGRQVMFTLWAKATADTYPAVEPAIKFMQEQFMFLGEHEPDVFTQNTIWRWQYLALLVGLLAIVWLIRRQRMKRQATPADLSEAT